MRTFNFFTLCVLFLTSNAFSQDYALDKGATILSGTGSFISQGGDLFQDSKGNNSNIFTLVPTINYFIVPNVAIGAGLAYTNYSQGDFNSSSIEIGHSISYFVGDQDSNNYPYFFGAIHYSNSSSGRQNISGSDINFGIGLITPIQDRGHLGFVMEAGYHILNLKNDSWSQSVSGNKIAIGIGIVGMIF